MEYGSHISSWVYANDGKYKYTGPSGHIDDCSKFICGTYAFIVVTYEHEIIGKCGI